MPLTIRPADPADIPFMAEIRAQTKGTAAFWTDRIERYLRGAHSPRQALEPRSVFVAAEDGKIAGFVAGHRTRRFDCDGEVQWIDIDREYRRRGIGRELMAEIGAWFVMQKATRVCVNVDINNLAARKLYEKCGARSLDKAWMIWDDASLIGR